MKRIDLLRKEINFLSKAYVVIVHNEEMGKVLYNFGLSSPSPYVVSLGLFDYLYRRPYRKMIREFGKIIVFAGNLNKSIFLRKLINLEGEIVFYLYGIGFNEKLNGKNISYRGSFSPEELVCKIEGNFGLIWDGNDIETCSGFMGEYLKINNPHKLSLYIASALPVIVWEEAAIAKFVNEFKIGFTIKSLYDLEKKLESLDKGTYQNYIDNMEELRVKVRKGDYMKRAIEVVSSYNNRG